MNTPALVSRADPSALPAWSPADLRALSYPSYPDSAGPQNNSAHLFSALRRYWWLLVIVWAVIAIPTTIILYTEVKPGFVSTAAIRVSPLITNPVAVGNVPVQTPFYLEFLRTQQEFMKSSRVLQRAAEDPRLKAYPWFSQLTDQIDYLTKNVEVQMVPSSQIITVAVTHPDAHAATDIANSVIDAYIRLVTEDEENNVGKSLTILKQFRDHTESFLKDANDKLYKLDSGGTALSTEDDRKIVTDLLSTSQSTLAKLESDQITLIATLDATKNRPAPDEKNFKDALNLDSDGQIEKWTAEKIAVQLLDNKEASRRATPEHPDRVQFRKQIKVLDQKIAQRKQELLDQHWQQNLASANLEKAKRVAELENDLKGVSTQLTSLRGRIVDLDKQAKTAAGRIQPILALREQIADNKDSLKRYNDRIQELESQNVAPGRVNVGWNATVPLTPKVDRRPKFAAIANIGGLLLGTMVVVLLSRFRNRIETCEDLPESFQNLVVGTVSNAGHSTKSLQSHMRKKILGEEMRLVHANLLPPGKQQRRVMMVTSPTPGNGKTSIASQLALSLAKTGVDVLLVDADLRKRDLTSMFDIGFRPGLAELLQGQPPELVRPVELLPNFKVMGAGAPLNRNPAELFQQRHLRESLELLQDKFDCIIVDTPPALVVADARLIAPSCDEVLCVVRANISSNKDIQETVDAVTRITGEAPKIIVNGVEHRGQYYKYKFSYTKDQNGDDGELAGNGQPPKHES